MDVAETRTAAAGLGVPDLTAGERSRISCRTNIIISWTSATNAGERCPKNQNATIYYYYSWTTKHYNRIRVWIPSRRIFRRDDPSYASGVAAPPSPDTTVRVLFSVADIVGSNQPATTAPPPPRLYHWLEHDCNAVRSSTITAAPQAPSSRRP